MDGWTIEQYKNHLALNEPGYAHLRLEIVIATTKAVLSQMDPAAGKMFEEIVDKSTDSLVRKICEEQGWEAPKDG